ncbi:hypothetical protein EV122DRAFT_293335 [Schizophyllum commune]
MDADRPAKRQRVHEDDATPVQRSDIWFDDGNIILQAENLQFRVHRSLLARHSPVFKDVFGIPQPESSLEVLIEGCPVVHLTDKATDVEFMLTRLFGLASPENLRKAPTVSELILPSLRMGHKYLVAHLWDDSVACLRRAFPTDLVEMQEAMAKDSKLITKGDDATCIRLADGDHLLHLVDVLVAVGLETVLPALYYRILWSTNVPWTNNEAKTCNCHEQRLQFYLSTIDGMLPVGTCFDTQQTTVCGRCRESYLHFVGIMRTRVYERLPKVFNLPFWRELRDFNISEGSQVSLPAS